jgi:hypothetical protein
LKNAQHFALRYFGIFPTKKEKIDGLSRKTQKNQEHLENFHMKKKQMAFDMENLVNGIVNVNLFSHVRV